jgi:hypothetical protein
MKMKLRTACAMVVACGCSGPRSQFDFDLGGDVNERVSSSPAGATGAIDNAGHLALDDALWGLGMSLPGTGPATYELGPGPGSLAITSKASGDVFSTTPTGSCTVTIDPHAPTNGSSVSATFSCKGLTSYDGSKHVDVSSGALRTLIDDVANNPSPL